MASTCGNCKYQVPPECRRYPPARVSPSLSGWPLVDPDDWCGEWSGGATAPPPTLTSLTPNSLPAGSAPATVDVAGTNYDPTCVILANGATRDTFYIDATHLQYTARPDLAISGDTVQIAVQNNNGTSSSLTFTYT
jgi:IPT/TIG domain-containing protein